MTMKRIAIVAILLALSDAAFAQPAVECKKTETQAECHTRLRCKADEDVEDCQKRLRAAGNQTNGDNGGRDDGGRDDRDNGRDDRGGRDRGGRDDRYDDGGGRRQRGRGRNGGGRRSRRGGGRSSSFQANKTFGLGVELGEPTGINGKYFLSDSRALDFGLGYIYEHYYYGDGVHLYIDHLWHPTTLVSSPALELPFYVGVGARFWDFEYCERVGNVDICDTGSALGVRIPFGIAFDFNNAPIDIFLQLVPVVDLIYGDYYDRFDDRGHFGIDGNIGFRFWFN
jgi:hypothetical protein